MDEEYLFSAVHCWSIDGNMPVKTTRPQQGFIKDIWPVRPCQNDDLLRGIEAVHFGKDLIKRGLSLVISTTEILLRP